MHMHLILYAVKPYARTIYCCGHWGNNYYSVYFILTITIEKLHAVFVFINKQNRRSQNCYTVFFCSIVNYNH